MLHHLIFFLIFLSIGILGGIVFLKNSHNRTHQSFVLLIVILEIWIIAHYWQDEAIFKKYAPFLLKLDFASGIFLCVSFYLFSRFFSQSIKFSIFEKFLIFIFVPLFSFLSFTNFVICNIHFRNDTIDGDPGILFLGYFLLASFFVINGIRTLFIKYKQSTGIEKCKCFMYY